MKFGLVISTCKHYYKNIPELIKELETCNFPKENIIIVSGQEDEIATTDENGIKFIKETYTGLHLTGLIHIFENYELYKDISYWIALPDTVKIGPQFYNNISSFFNNCIKNDIIYSIPFINPAFRQTMDMGILHIKQIQNMGNYLIKIKLNQPYTQEEVINLKNQLIIDENMILGCSVGKHVPKHLRTIIRYRDPKFKPPSIFLCYKNYIKEYRTTMNDKIVNCVVFTNIDLVKIQRNFNGLNNNLIMTL